MASPITINITNTLERGIIETEVQDRLTSSEKQLLFFKVKIIGDNISHFMLCMMFSNKLVCTGYLCKEFSK